MFNNQLCIVNICVLALQNLAASATVYVKTEQQMLLTNL